uniref:Uncharacterized protein n=1 Tax=Marinobacter nauticus TaxID=2743 RepID=A0A455W118_MARNT|nr:hypothetical protein YBY_07120 [Marinobacter nauticus]
MSEAMDGRREAHMEVLVAVFRRLFYRPANVKLAGCEKAAFSKAELTGDTAR